MEDRGKICDAGEIGSGHEVPVVYEIKLKEDKLPEDGIAEFKVNYKTVSTPSEDQSKTLAISAVTTAPQRLQDLFFMSSVVEFSLILRNSSYKGDANINAVIHRLELLNLTDNYKKEFLQLVKIYASNNNIS